MLSWSIFPFQCPIYGEGKMIHCLLQIMSIPLLSSYPFIAMLSGISLAIVVTCASMAKNILSVSSVLVMRLLFNLNWEIFMERLKTSQRNLKSGLVSWEYIKNNCWNKHTFPSSLPSGIRCCGCCRSMQTVHLLNRVSCLNLCMSDVSGFCVSIIWAKLEVINILYLGKNVYKYDILLVERSTSEVDIVALKLLFTDLSLIYILDSWRVPI